MPVERVVLRFHLGRNRGHHKVAAVAAVAGDSEAPRSVVLRGAARWNEKRAPSCNREGNCRREPKRKIQPGHASSIACSESPFRERCSHAASRILSPRARFVTQITEPVPPVWIASQ